MYIYIYMYPYSNNNILIIMIMIMIIIIIIHTCMHTYIHTYIYIYIYNTYAVHMYMCFTAEPGAAFSAARRRKSARSRVHLARTCGRSALVSCNAM